MTVPPRSTPPPVLRLDASAAVSDALLAGQVALNIPAGGMSVREIVLGSDDRVPVEDTQSAPWCQICALSIEAADGSAWRGTGWIVGPRTVLTAGHCLFLHRRGGWVRSVTVAPGASGAHRPFGWVVATEFRSVTGWVEDESEAHDYGAIILPEGVSAAPLGTMRFIELLGDEAEGFTANIAGYPGDKPENTLWWDSRTIAESDAAHLRYEIDTTGGQSGSPVWLMLGEERFAIGLHTLGGVTANSAVKIAPAVFDRFAEWASIA